MFQENKEKIGLTVVLLVIFALYCCCILLIFHLLENVLYLFMSQHCVHDNNCNHIFPCTTCTTLNVKSKETDQM